MHPSPCVTIEIERRPADKAFARPGVSAGAIGSLVLHVVAVLLIVFALPSLPAARRRRASRGRSI